jgi:hypothetical protein
MSTDPYAKGTAKFMTHMRMCTQYRITKWHTILWLQYGLHLWQQSWQTAVLALEKGKDLRSVHLQLIKLHLWKLLQQIGIWRTKPPTENFDTLPLRSKIYNIGIHIYRLQKIDTMLLPTMHENLSSKDY